MKCKNRYGEFSDGRKVVGIHFRNNSEALITTADNRLRIVNIEVYIYISKQNLNQTYKYKGHSNVRAQMTWPSQA